MPLFSKRDKSMSRGQRRAKRGALTTYYRSETSRSSPSPFKKKPPKKNHRKLFFGLADVALIILLAFGLAYSLIVNPRPIIKADDSSYHSAKEYESVAAKGLDALKNRNKITFDSQSVISDMQKKFPEISSGSVELPFFSQTPTIRLHIDKPSFRLTSGGENYIVDSGGVVVAKASDLTNIKGLYDVIDQSGFVAAIGKQVLSSSETGFIDTVIAECKRAKVPISSLTLPASPQEMDLRANGQPYFVKFYLGGDALSQTGQFLAARAQFAKNGGSPSQYLDVRVSGKIFYK